MLKKTPSRRERSKERQRQEMLDAALTLFSERGYHNVTMHEIAAKAEFAIGTLYKFFKSKEDLYKALMLQKMDEVNDSVISYIEEQTDEVEKLKAFIRSRGRLFTVNIPLIRLYFSEAFGESFNPKAEMNVMVRQVHDEFLMTIADIFESGIRKKRFRNVSDPYNLAVALDAITMAFLFRWYEDPQRRSFPEDPDIILNILFKGLVD